MKRLTLLVSGNVQKAGYRDIIIRLVMALGLRGYAENLPDGRVKVVAEGEEKKLELLKESAGIKNTLINVEKIESSYSGAAGEFSDFLKLVREGETDERLDRAAELMKELIGAVQSGLNETVTAIKSVKADTSAMLEKQDSMLEKQDSLIKITEKGFTDMKIGFMEVKEEIRSVRLAG
jgi:acylphosphatase